MAHQEHSYVGGAHEQPVAPGVYQEHEHPSERVYITVGAILAVITAVEVFIYYVEAVEDFLVPMLLVLSTAKFVAVVGYFMHLKFDDRRFTWIFGFGLAVALGVFLGTAALFIANTFNLTVW
jgi:cytochrome c oxidase subunit 4